MAISFFKNIAFVIIINCVYAAVHDELAQCGLKGIYKTRQSVLTSPNYPNQYAANSCWDYVVLSPYRCPTKFHIQFLDFMLESSTNCSHDYLAIGIDTDDEDMDILCGKVAGIKKYYTPDGILKLRFYADGSKWSRGKGFKILITRLACESPDILRDLQDDTDTVVAPTASNSLSEDKELSLLQSLSLNEQYDQTQFGIYPGLPWFKSNACATSQATPLYQEKTKLAEAANLPNLSEQWQLSPLLKSAPEALARQQTIGVLPQTESCCYSSFSEERFYLSSPGFPRTVLTSLLPTQQRDCSFQLEKYTQNVCRVRIIFKYFDFGQPYVSTVLGQNNLGVPPIGTTSDVCSGDFLEIDGLRFCGCRSGFITTIRWDSSIKLIRMRMGFSGISSNGFLLELTQEECQLLPTDNVVNNGVSSLGEQAPLSDAIPLQPLNTFIGRFPQRPAAYPMIVNYPPLAYNPYVSAYYPRVVYPQMGLAGYPQYRQARFANYNNEKTNSQPSAVVETNSTRKEFYFFEDEQHKEHIKAERRIDDGEDTTANKPSERISLTSKNRCVFSSSDIFKLLIDPLWIRKQICISPQRRLLGTLFG